MKLSLFAALLAVGLAGCATEVGPPSDRTIVELETVRVLEPFASPTREPGHYVVEFGPEVEVRNISCQPEGKAMFRCRFEARTKPFLEEFDDWTPRQEIVVRRRHRWRFLAPASAGGPALRQASDAETASP